MQRVFLRATLGLLTAASLLLLAEGALRLLGLPDPGLYEGDLRTVWWLRPGLDRQQPFPLEGTAFPLQTNALGLRGAPPPSEGPWTLALGCSTTFGWGVTAAQAWPAVLSEALGEPVVNGGVPGWSTHQARLGAARYLEQRPSRVVLGYIVRDAQPALRPDADSTPTPWPLRSHIGRGLLLLLQPTAAAAGTGFDTSLPAVRVPVDAYRRNIARLIEMAESAGADVYLLGFPQQQPAGAWRAALEEQGRPYLAPVVPDSGYFEHDPIHLTPQGHRALAEAIADAWWP